MGPGRPAGSAHPIGPVEDGEPDEPRKSLALAKRVPTLPVGPVEDGEPDEPRKSLAWAKGGSDSASGRMRESMPQPPRQRPVRPVLLAACCAMAMAVYAVYLGGLGVLLPLLGAKYGLGTEVQGRLFPANFSGFVVGVLVCGWLSDRHGRKAVMAGGAALYCVGLVLMAAAPGFSAILIASALVGAGSGAMEVVASALAGDAYPAKRAFLLNGIQVAFGVGAIAGPVVVRAAAGSSLGWSSFLIGIA